MGIMGIKMRIMPSSPKVNLEPIKLKIKEIIESNKGRSRSCDEEPIAFGLKAIIAFFEWPEEKELEQLETKLKSIKDVSSIQVIDMRKIA